MASYRVLKAHGLWRVGDIRTGSALSMLQGVRAGVLELIVEAKPATYTPVIGTSRRRKKDSDGEVSV